METFLRSFRIPEILVRIVEARWKELGYENRSIYLLSLVLYDLLIRRPHPITLAIARQQASERDLIYGEISRMYNSGEVGSESWFKNQLREAVKEVADGKDVPEPRIIATLLKRLRDGEPS